MVGWLDAGRSKPRDMQGQILSSAGWLDMLPIADHLVQCVKHGDITGKRTLHRNVKKDLGAGQKLEGKQ